MIKAEECIQYKAENDIQKGEAVKKIMEVLDGLPVMMASDILLEVQGEIAKHSVIELCSKQ